MYIIVWLALAKRPVDNNNTGNVKQRKGEEIWASPSCFYNFWIGNDEIYQATSKEIRRHIKDIYNIAKPIITSPLYNAKLYTYIAYIGYII